MQKEFEEAVRNIFKINEIVRQLDESIRPQAFQILASVSAGRYIPPIPEELPTKLGLTGFAGRYGRGTPAQNVVVLAAWMFLHEGEAPITARRIHLLANSCGLPVPRRPDCTMRYASHGGSPIFERGDGGWYLNAAGRDYVVKAFRQYPDHV